MEIMISYQRQLERHGHKYLALYHALREAILNGTLARGSRLPSTRKLAELYGISRGSAAEAYDLLLAEGYVESAVGRGTYVAAQLAELPKLPINDKSTDQSANYRSNEYESQQRIDTQAFPHKPYAITSVSADLSAVPTLPATDSLAHHHSLADHIQSAESASSMRPQLSRWGQRVLDLDNHVQDKNINTQHSLANAASSSFKQEGDLSPISFAPPDILLSGSSLSAWKTALASASRDMQSPDFASSTGIAGDERLREAICTHLGRTRGIQARPEQVVLCSGSMEVIVLLCQLLINEQDHVVLEDPCYNGIARAITASGGQIIPAPLDRHGILPQDWASQLLFVTPGRQFPTGVILPLARRQQLLQWADRHSAWIVEDDYDSEFRWGGRPIEPLKALDTSESVIYVGSFSKSMFSGLRIGYAVMPPGLSSALIAAKKLYDPLPSSQLEQRALARFMMRGEYMRHLRRMTRLYRSRFDVMQQHMDDTLHGLFDWMPTDSGLHRYGIWTQSVEQYESFRREASELQVQWRDAADSRLTPGPPSVCFSFAQMDEFQIEEGIRRLQLAWQRVLQNQW
ncbi:PLP-dependent aminotransferase family protein [Paenibacillus kandeliae]|uniref:aminotransferase-like domain-containing protein n=1 Tax=Paenibacillus kandeliae TaxID=3231269 RepID=UPI00345AA591